MTSSVRDTVAIVTGGTSGIGRATGIALARAGARVAVVGRSAARLKETLAVLRSGSAGAPDGNLPLGLILDVRNASDMSLMAQRVLDVAGRIDILVTVAGIGASRSVARAVPPAVVQTSGEEWDEVVDTNLKGMFLAIRAVLPAMMAQRCGEIVNVSSSRGATRGRPFAAAYCASKHGVMGLSEALAEEMRSYGVRVQVVLPDATETPMLKVAGHLARQGALAAEEVADFIVHLLELPDDTVMVDPLIAPFAMTGAAS